MHNQPAQTTPQATPAPQPRLHCSKSYIYTLIQSGELEAYRLGEKRGLRVTKRSLTAKLSRCRVDPEEYCE